MKVISIGMFVPGNQPVVWRGPMLHRALQQFLADVFWGDLDVLLLDLPPGTGDIAISVAQLIPNAEILVVTTPQQAAAEVAERAGAIALQTHQRIAGVIENMSWLELPDGSRQELFGSGGGAGRRRLAHPGDRRAGPAARPGPARHPLREGGDEGIPVVLGAPRHRRRRRPARHRPRPRQPLARPRRPLARPHARRVADRLAQVASASRWRRRRRASGWTGVGRPPADRRPDARGRRWPAARRPRRRAAR